MRSITAAAAVCVTAGAGLAQETMYALSDPVFPILYTLDKATGDQLTAELVDDAEALFGGLAVDGAGDLYSIDGFNDAESDRLFRIDPETAAGEVVGDTGFNWNFRNVTVDPTTDTLYGSRDNELFTLDRETGAATSVATISGPTLDQLTTFAIDSSGTAYGTDIGDTGLFEIDLESGSASHLGNLGESNYFYDLAFDADDVLYGARLQGGVFTIDVDEATATSAFPGAYRGIVFLVEGGCDADCNGDGALNINDFVCFQQEWQDQSAFGDCDASGEYDVLDFVCYQQVFQAGCP